MNIVVIALDPGITTGYVAARITDKLVKVRPLQSRDSVKKCYDLLDTIKPDIIICEDFEIRPRSPVNLELFSVQLIGVVNLYQQATVPKPVVYMQKAAIAKAGHYNSITALKKAGVYVPGDATHHAMDAMRHFMQWFFFRAGYQYNKNQPIELVK